MVREWADEETREMIEDALRSPTASMADTWDDDEAWASFQDAMRAEHR